LRVEAFDAQGFLVSSKIDVLGCLIPDVGLRGESGLAIQEQIANSNLRIPILSITERGYIERLVKAIKAAALDFVPKPFRDHGMLDPAPLR
jgi:FixJ family two-component response regulator